ncbi:hypothetical protein DFJ58DRAFT_731905 [Suillus subalutaceus]|uniref:uncharacterized protein n=1 Tax=Suillus subalutaceus TaxID=48586 RepID=UPI001B87F06B|nr:uncharacterized protein DFJ58DRAFT_731905 [Suillus subalutaceus]KAG1842746.1 hypothetical protein DFJ58DRAFT_731905 [Suillus subalutaceus]
MEHDGGGEKDRQNTDDYRESAPNSHKCNTPDDNPDHGDDFDSNMEMLVFFFLSLAFIPILCSHCRDRDAGQYTHQPTDDIDEAMNFNENLDRPCPDNEARGDIEQVDLDDEPTDTEQDKVYDVLEHHHAKNRQRKAPSPTYLSKGKEGACTVNRPQSPRRHPSQHVHSKSPCPQSPQCVRCSKSHVCSESPRPCSPQRIRRSPTCHSSHSKSPHQQSSQQVKYVCSSSSCMQSTLQRPSRPITSSSRSHTQPTSRGCSPSRSPSDPILSSSHEHSHTSTPEDAHRSSNSKRRVKTNHKNPSKLEFYPPTWQAFLQTAKLEMQLQAILVDTIPEFQDALNLA